MKKIFYTALLLLTFAACQQSGNGKDYDQMAKDLCGCMRPLADINTRIKKLVREGKTDQVASLFTEVERLSKDGEACANSLEKKYGAVEGESETKASAALKKHCPDIAQMLEESEAAVQ
ncbi:MAG: hypothetical protein AAF960_06600 [Bacteroidota bacterium]